MGLPVGPPAGGVPVLPSPGQPAPLRPGEFTPSSIPALTTFNINGIAPPSALYIGRDDQLLLQAITLNALDTVTVNIRMLTAAKREALGGQPDTPVVAQSGMPPVTSIEFGSATLSMPVANVLVSKLVPLAEGFLLSLAAVSGGVVNRGLTFVRATLLRGGATLAFGTQTLFSDYCTTGSAATWPGGRVISSVETPGFLALVTVANPGAGLEWSRAVPAGQRWRISSLQATFTASAAAATRIPQIQVTKVSTGVGVCTPSGTVVANGVAVVSAYPGATSAPAGVVNIVIALPSPIIIGPSGLDSIGSLTGNLQGGDAYTNIALAVEQWFDF